MEKRIPPVNKNKRNPRLTILDDANGEVDEARKARELGYASNDAKQQFYKSLQRV